MRRLSSFSSYLPKAVAVALAGGMALLSGCGLGTIATDVTPQAVSGVQISGIVHGASTPISGATVTLYASGTTGYGAGTTSLGTGTTAITTGAFTISPTFTSSLCSDPAHQVLYVTVTGGDPTGNTTTVNNHAILLADVLGPCNSVTSSIKISISEATTVAAAYALSGFSTVTSVAGGTASLSIGAPSTNYLGLLDAAANAVLLVSPSYGTNSSTSSVLLPTATLNSIANTITGCVNTTDYTAFPCADQTSPAMSGLFTLATPPVDGGAKPSNVYQAVLNIAKYPGNNVPALLQLGSAYSLFQPSLSTTTVNSTTSPYTTPNDLTLGVGYPNSTLAGSGQNPIALAVDNSDNVFAYGTGTTSYQFEVFAPSSGTAPATTALGVAAAGTIETAISDASGNIWIGDNDNLGDIIEVSLGAAANAKKIYLADPVKTGPFDGTQTVGANTWGIAVDGSGNVWTSSYRSSGNCASTLPNAAVNKTCEYQELLSGASTFTYTFGSTPVEVPNDTVRGMFADANTNPTASAYVGHIWAANNATSGGTSPGTVAILTPSTGAVVYPKPGTTSGNPTGIALDHNSNGWITNNGGSKASSLYYLPANSTSATTGTLPTFASPATVPNASQSPFSTTASGVSGIKSPRYLAIDGNGDLFIANTGYNSIVQYSPSATLSSVAGVFLSPYFGFSPSLGSNQTVLTCTTPQSTSNCSITGDTIIVPSGGSGNYPVSIDKAGTVWTLSNNGTVVGIIGTAAPTDPVLADGKYGVKP